MVEHLDTASSVGAHFPLPSHFSHNSISIADSRLGTGLIIIYLMDTSYILLLFCKGEICTIIAIIVSPKSLFMFLKVF